MRKIIILCSILMMAGGENASAQSISFDIAARRAELQKPEYAQAREYCLAAGEKWSPAMPQPIAALHSTEGYGTDNGPEAFTWYIMVLGGRALAGDAQSESDLRKALLTWASADALAATKTSHDTFYALKRYMLPVVVNYAIAAAGMTSAERQKVERWIDGIVRRLDRKFNGDVDHNNHRALADSVLMAWGSFTGDEKLYKKGIEGYSRMLTEARPDGALPLETRRGARAIWYLRHAITSMVLMAEIAHMHGDDLYATKQQGVSLETLMNYLLTVHYAPIKILPDAAENYIPGPDANYIEQDQAFLQRRGHGRHYMSFAEAYVHQPGFAARRLQALMRKTGFNERPLIDEYFGGNATCFFWRPRGE